MGFFEEKKKGAFKANSTRILLVLYELVQGCFFACHCTAGALLHPRYLPSILQKETLFLFNVVKDKKLNFIKFIEGFSFKLFFSVGKEHHDR